VVLPLHPRTRKRIAEFGLQLPTNVRVVDPVGYLDMLLLESEARLIATDSGGVQKEAYFHRVPCVTLRDETEWVELVELGVNRLVGTDAAAIAEAVAGHVFRDVQADVYGDGRASQRIAAALAQF
jgi:UDP-GlcNAc3NAcA epimerase